MSSQETGFFMLFFETQFHIQYMGGERLKSASMSYNRLGPIDFTII